MPADSRRLDAHRAIGIEPISNQIHQLTNHLISGLQSKGYQISPRDGNQWSGIVSFTSPRHDHAEIECTLRANHQTEIVLREGRLRVSPHFYNTPEQIERLIEHLPGH